MMDAATSVVIRTEIASSEVIYEVWLRHAVAGGHTETMEWRRVVPIKPGRLGNYGERQAAAREQEHVAWAAYFAPAHTSPIRRSAHTSPIRRSVRSKPSARVEDRSSV